MMEAKHLSSYLSSFGAKYFYDALVGAIIAR